MCHPKGRSAAKDARSALTRRPARSYSAPTIPATVRYARRRSGERHERSIPRPPALPAPLADPPIAPQPTHTRLRRAFLEHRIGDRRVLRLITKWLNAGVMENGEWKDDLQGTPQGAVVSPILANVYLHYVLDLWFQKKWRARKATGDTIIVRYADDCAPRRRRREAAMAA